MNPQFRRLLLDLGPLVLFFLAFQFFGFYVATVVVMAAIVTSSAIGYWLERKLSPMAIVTLVIVMLLGGLTLYLKNKTFLMMKPTIVYLIFAGALLGGLGFNRLFIKYALSFEFDLPEEAWRGLTWRWGIFFLGLAGLNEIVWRNFSEGQWVFFKVWVILPLIFVFALTQTPYMLKHQVARNNPD